MRRSSRPTLIKFGIFAVVMAMLTASLFFIFGQYQTGSTKDYSAVFADASRLKQGSLDRHGLAADRRVDDASVVERHHALVLPQFRRYTQHAGLSAIRLQRVLSLGT